MPYIELLKIDENVALSANSLILYCKATFVLHLQSLVKMQNTKILFLYANKDSITD